MKLFSTCLFLSCFVFLSGCGSLPQGKVYGWKTATTHKNRSPETSNIHSVRTSMAGDTDSITFVFSEGRIPGYHIDFSDAPYRKRNAIEPLKVKGNAWMFIKFSPAKMHTEDGGATIASAERHLNYPNLKEAEAVFEENDQVAWVLGLDRRTEYRVKELKNPARIVVEIKR